MALAALWNAAGLHFRAEYVERELRAALARNPGLVIVADEPLTGLACSVFGTFDGRRGWANRLATSPDRRGKGIGTALVRELERRLLAKGWVKINLLVEPDNADVVPFYERLGFDSRSMIFMDKWIAAPPGPPAPDSGAGAAGGGGRPAAAQAAPPAPGVPAAPGWSRHPARHAPRALRLRHGPEPPPDLEPFAFIREDEGDHPGRHPRPGGPGLRTVPVRWPPASA